MVENNISLSGFRKINLLAAYKLLIFLAVPSLAVEGLGQKRKEMLFSTTTLKRGQPFYSPCRESLPARPPHRARGPRSTRGAKGGLMGLFAKPSGVCGIPKIGIGFITEGDLLDFNSSFPNSSTTLYGVDLCLNFEGYIDDGLGDEVDREGRPTGQVGRLVLSYYQGRSEETLTEDDLPIGGTLADLLQFRMEREATSHMGIVEWRWPSNKPVYQTSFFDGDLELKFIHPWFALGAGADHTETTIQRDEEDPTHHSNWLFLVTGATGGELAQLRYRGFSVTLDAETRLFAGQAFGMFGLGGVELAYNW
ncbi:MAG: hypothetical protein A2053_00425 [Deltaproteobacteria bacterium GWA2_50_8]|nr:MAG: hypothetical protein A2053_00425 [Deltaproteobacteria bacterium GWA2_50_8]